MKRLQITPEQATTLHADGYEVVTECYLILPCAEKPKPAYTKVFVPKDAVIGLSIENTGPAKGKMAGVWKTTKQVLWGKNVTRTHRRSEVETALKAAGNTDKGMFAYLIRMGCIREIKPKQEKLV